MLVALATEVAVFYTHDSAIVVTAAIGILAASQAVSIVIFYMHLKDEPGSIRLFALIPVMFLSALLIAMVATLG